MNADNIPSLNPGQVIEVEVDSPALAFLWAYINQRKDKPSWKARIAELIAGFDGGKFKPLYYCCVHRRLEDGTHRLHIAKMRGMSTVQVEAHARCHHFNPNLFTVLEMLVKANVKGDKKDLAWLTACRDKKWHHLAGAVDYSGASVLDIGSHCGFVCLGSVLAGATSAVGLELRADMAALATKAAAQLKVDHRVSFRQADWLAAGPLFQESFDIVHCLGLPHYFPANHFEVALNSMVAAARRLLILELRLDPGPGARLTRAGTQTLPTHGWLTQALAKKGFKVTKKFPVVGELRQLWISERVR